MSKTTKTTKTTKTNKADKGSSKADKGKTKTPKRPAPTTFGLKVGKSTVGSATSSTGADGVVRTRASWTGKDGTHSLSSLLKWVGANGGDISNARALVESLGLEDTTSASTVSCQFYSGVAWKDGAKQNHPGEPADLSKTDAAAVRKLAGM